MDNKTQAIKFDHADVNEKKIIKMGQCSWTDESLIRSGKFYPSSSNMNSTERLKFYSNVFPCVEVDMSTYAIPPRNTCEKWTEVTPKNFLLHFKAFQMFTHRICDFKSLPFGIRSKFGETTSVVQSRSNGTEKVAWRELDSTLQSELWNAFNGCLQPAIDAKKMGVVLFQFQQDFFASDENRFHLLDCRKHLNSNCKMAVEFRSKTWLIEPELSNTIHFLKQNQIALVGIDEPGLVPIVLKSTTDFMYIRVHRRTGAHRLLSEVELNSWAERLKSLEHEGVIYMMWNTNHENQSILNSQHLTKKIENLVFNWKQEIESKPGTINQMFAKKSKEKSEVEKPKEIPPGKEEEIPPSLTKEEVKSPPTTPKKRPASEVSDQTSKKKKIEKVDPKQKGIESFFGKKG